MKIRLCFSEARFEYDIYHLVQAFYPRAEILITYEETADDAALVLSFVYGPWSCAIHLVDGADRRDLRCDFAGAAGREEQKSRLKRLVYAELVRISGRELPWGDLSGIRPVRLFRRALAALGDPQAAVRAMEQQYCVSSQKALLCRAVAENEQRILSDPSYRDAYSLYIDIPFCPSICLYCSFGSHPIARFAAAVDDYLEALHRELSMIASLMRDVPLDSIYIGGGTPTSLPADKLDALLQFVEQTFPVADAKELTVEAGRPDTLDEEMLSMLASHPVSRISINPQTMRDETLVRIGRAHTAAQTEEAFHLARAQGFSNINMDMIVGLPGEGEAEVRESLKRIELLSPDALTVHSLAGKRAAALTQAKEARDAAFVNSEEIMARTEASARVMQMQPYYLYRQKNIAGNFENVGYAREGKACRYNILIMEELQTILGAGCGATSKRVDREGHKLGRARNVKDLKEYIRRTDEMCARKYDLFNRTGEEKR